MSLTDESAVRQRVLEAPGPSKEPLRTLWKWLVCPPCGQTNALRSRPRNARGGISSPEGRVSRQADGGQIVPNGRARAGETSRDLTPGLSLIVRPRK